MRLNLLIVFIFYSSFCVSQTDYEYYMYLSDYNIAPQFDNINGVLTYSGDNRDMESFFAQYTILEFHQAFSQIPDFDILNVFKLKTTSDKLADEMLDKYGSIFVSYDNLTGQYVETLLYPNDYGTTSPVTNSGANADRTELDYINAPSAWDVTTGDSKIIIGISDTGVNNSYTDLSKSLTINGSSSGSHGTNVGALAAASGNNAYGTVGVCYDCDLLSAGIGFGNTSEVIFSNLYALAINGARVINMSWYNGVWYAPVGVGYRQVEQDIINYIVDNFDVTFVAATGNKSSFTTAANLPSGNGTPYGILHLYPASYDNVISVSSVNHYYPELNVDSFEVTNPFGQDIYLRIQDAITIMVDGTDINNPVCINFSGFYQNPDNPNGFVNTHTLNESVDILSTGYQIFQYYDFENSNTITYGNGTSYSAPIVSGTIGLMLTINECLTNNQIETILKLTSKDIEHDLTSDLIQPNPMNAIAYGIMGSGKLEVDKSVQFVDEISNATGTAEIKDHIFHRGSYILNNILNSLVIENSRFVQDAQAEFVAGNSIELLEGTLLEPYTNSYIDLSIDSNISGCNYQAKTFNNTGKIKEENNQENSAYKVFPTLVNRELNIVNDEEFNKEGLIAVEIYDILGFKVYEASKLNSNEAILKLNDLKSGIYVVKIYDNKHNVIHTEKIIKK